MFHFLETDTREQKKYEVRTQTSVDNTVNYLRYEIKGKTKITFIKQKIAFLSLAKIYFILGDLRI